MIVILSFLFKAVTKWKVVNIISTALLLHFKKYLDVGINRDTIHWHTSHIIQYWVCNASQVDFKKGLLSAQVSQAWNSTLHTWSKRQLLYIENCMGKPPIIKNVVNNYLIWNKFFLPQIYLTCCADFEATLMLFSEVIILKSSFLSKERKGSPLQQWLAWSLHKLLSPQK